jgi:hypothetical protein
VGGEAGAGRVAARAAGAVPDGNPVLWLTCRAGRLTGWSGLAWLLYVLLSVAFSALAGLITGRRRASGCRRQLDRRIGQAAVRHDPRGCMLLADERARRALGVLPPHSHGQILTGYWLGAFRPVPPADRAARPGRTGSGRPGGVADGARCPSSSSPTDGGW